jgi:DNA mismatch repair protein MutS2
LSALVMVPTLLDPEPLPRVDEALLRETLAFAFATGDIGDGLERLVDQMPLAPTSWQARDFARDVFLDVVAERCFPIVIGGRTYNRSRTLLSRILGAPPSDVRVVRYRQRILAELTKNPGLRSGVENLYRALTHLRSLLSKTTATRVDPFERRLAVLRALRDTADLAVNELGAATSGLAKVATWGRETVAKEGFARLRELLAYEGGSAEIDVRLCLGFDGKVRELRILDRREPTDNAFHQGPAARFASKLGLFVRGYQFSAHEVFARLADEVFEQIVDDFLPVFPLMGDLEFYLGCLGFRDATRRAGLDVALPVFAGGSGGAPPREQGHALIGLYNPLLLSEGARVVPCDVATGSADARVIVTGPNSGGKTRLLQAIALSQILGQAGAFVPARSARLPWASGMFVSILEGASADQREGRLGTELLRIRRLFESLKAGSLVVLDELCSGTNPSEGEEIFRLVVKLLGELRPAAFITTHFLAFARRLSEEASGLEFLQVELDAEERPTYLFVPGVATTSLAHKTAARLGVTEDALRALVAARADERPERPSPAGEVSERDEPGREACSVPQPPV